MGDWSFSLGAHKGEKLYFFKRRRKKYNFTIL